MKSYSFVFSVSAYLIFASAIFPFRYASASASPLHVMVDAGHGGVDTGAVRGQLKESEIALKVALELARLLKADPEFKVSMTRMSDKKVPLWERTQLAQTMKADIFLSIHLNSSLDTRARGKEIYFQNQLAADEDALFLASHENSEDSDAGDLTKAEEPNSAKTADTPAKATNELFSSRTDLRKILDDLHRNHRIAKSSDLSKILIETWEAKFPTTRFGSRAIRQAPFQVVSRINIPSVLVEIGFISHAQEGPLLAQVSHQKLMAHSLYEGLRRFKETVDKSRPQKLESATQ